MPDDARQLFSCARLQVRARGVEQHVGQVDDQAARGLARLEDDVELIAQLPAQLDLVALGLRRGGLRLLRLRLRRLVREASACSARGLRRAGRLPRRARSASRSSCALSARARPRGAPLRLPAVSRSAASAARCLRLRFTLGLSPARLFGLPAYPLGLPTPRFLGTGATECRPALALSASVALLGLIRLFLPLQPDEPRVFRRLRRLPRGHHRLVALRAAAHAPFRRAPVVRPALSNVSAAKRSAPASRASSTALRASRDPAAHLARVAFTFNARRILFIRYEPRLSSSYFALMTSTLPTAARSALRGRCFP